MRERERMQAEHVEELTVAECHRLLAGQHIGRIALVERGAPVIFPVTYLFQDDQIVFRTGDGATLTAAAGRAGVAFEVDAVDEASRTGWSVLARGKAAEVTEPAALASLRSLQLTPWAPGDKQHYVRILPTSITGRRISVPAGLGANWLG
jgi:nitroimidazol reductase NimA-like FMN-containing flavoprotein (pyridoxamine 5'-phosphate oxidase superfamily)